MGHMTSIRKKSTMIVAFAAILSMTMGFMPQSEAGSIPLTLNFGLVCGVTIPVAAIALVGGPTFTGGFSLQNTGNGIQDVLANIGLGWSGTIDTILHLVSSTTTLDATDTGAGALGAIAMNNAGTDVTFANLVGSGPVSTVSISVDGSAPINPPFSGEQGTTLFVTADVGDCHA